MADPFSVAVATLSLADIACRMTTEVSGLISAIRHASTNRIQLKSKLEELGGTSQSIQKLLETYRASSGTENVDQILQELEKALKSLTDDLHQLESSVNVTSYRGTLSRLWHKAKPILKRQATEEHLIRLEKDQANISSLLLILGRQNDCTIMQKVEEVHAEVKLVQDVSTTQFTSIKTRLIGLTTAVSKLEDHMDTLGKLEVSVASNGHIATATICGSAVQGAATLSSLYPLLHHILVKAASGQNGYISRAESFWLDTEVKRLLKDVWLVGAEEIQKENQGRLREPAKRQPFSATTLYPPARGSLVPYFPKAEGLTSILGSSEYTLPNGKLVVVRKSERISYGVQSRVRSISTFRIIYIPSADRGLSGIAASFVQSFGVPISVQPSLRIFGIHPDNALIFNFLRKRDNIGVRSLLSSGSVTPNDRDTTGQSILCYALSYYNLECCKLLLNEGADPHDCNKFGEAALTYFIKHLPVILNPHDLTHPEWVVSSHEVLNAIRLLIGYCGTELHGAVDFQHEQKIENRTVSILNCILSPDLAGAVDILEPMRLLIEDGCNVNEANPGGSSPLHRVLRALHDRELVPVTKALLEAGADPRAIEPGSQDGCLHKLLTRISACNRWVMSEAEQESVLELIVDLLQRGCDPCLINVGKRTPSDYALSPAAWPIWCSALCKAGYDVTAILQQDDTCKSIFQMGLYDVDTETKIIQVSTEESMRAPGQESAPSPALTRAPREHTATIVRRLGDLEQSPVCFVCGSRGRQYSKRKAPFDFFGTYLLGPRNCMSHEFRFCHEDGTQCMNHYEENACTNTEHREGYKRKSMKEELSWRKKMALELWESGVLGKPTEVQRWAQLD